MQISLEREFYAKYALKMGFSKSSLIDSIQQNDYERFMVNQTNFEQNLPKPDSERALMYIKDDYQLDFLNLPEPYNERDLETALVSNITKFLAELGGMFAFVGRQYKVTVSQAEYFIDLLFYHRVLKCLVAIELKIGAFEPEFAGKMNFYLSALDAQERVEGENPSIGIIICKQKDRTKVEYSLKDINKPIGVGTYNQYSKLEDIPKAISKYLPSEEEIKAD